MRDSSLYLRRQRHDETVTSFCAQVGMRLCCAGSGLLARAESTQRPNAAAPSVGIPRLLAHSPEPQVMQDDEEPAGLQQICRRLPLQEGKRVSAHSAPAIGTRAHRGAEAARHVLQCIAGLSGRPTHYR